MSDAALVLRARGGDEVAFQKLARTYRVVIRGYTKEQYFLGGGGDKDDLWQEGLIGLHKAVRGWQPSRGPFRAFARLCIERQIVTAVRASTRRKHEVLNCATPFSTPKVGNGDDEKQTVGELVPALGPGIHETVELQQDLAKVISICSERLTQTERRVVVGIAEGRTYEQLEALTGLSFKQIDNARTRGKSKLSQLLEAAA